MSEVKELELIELGEVSAETRGDTPNPFLENNGAQGCQARRPGSDDPTC